MITLWNIIFYKPLFNALVALVNTLPNHSLFFAVIILTIIVRFIISPLSYRSIRTQIQQKKIAPFLKEIKDSTSDKQEYAQKTLALYKEHGVNPFSGFLLLIVQFPIIIALYWVFRDGGTLLSPENLQNLYSFVSIPTEATFNTKFLGIELTEKSYLLAFLTGLTQYIHLSTSPSMKSAEVKGEKTQQEQVMQGVQKSMKYTMPVMITIFAYILSGAVALYWVTSNIFMYFQERVIYRRLQEKSAINEEAT